MTLHLPDVTDLDRCKKCTYALMDLLPCNFGRTYLSNEKELRKNFHVLGDRRKRVGIDRVGLEAHRVIRNRLIRAPKMFAQKV